MTRCKSGLEDKGLLDFEWLMEQPQGKPVSTDAEQSEYRQPAKCVWCVWGRWEASRQFCMKPVCVKEAVRGDAGREGGERAACGLGQTAAEQGRSDSE